MKNHAIGKLGCTKLEYSKYFFCPVCKRFKFVDIVEDDDIKVIVNAICNKCNSNMTEFNTYMMDVINTIDKFTYLKVSEINDGTTYISNNNRTSLKNNVGVSIFIQKSEYERLMHIVTDVNYLLSNCKNCNISIYESNENDYIMLIKGVSVKSTLLDKCDSCKKVYESIHLILA